MVYKNMLFIEQNYWRLKFPDLDEKQIEVYKSASLSYTGGLNHVDSQAINLMHWYAINLYNYALSCCLVQFLNVKSILPEHLAGNKKLICELNQMKMEYIKSIPDLQPVVHFRNKASAHFAIVDPFKNDNPATLLESFSLIPSFENGRVKIGNMQWVKGDSRSSFSDHPWSLVENFESLIPRYFKDNFN